MPELDLGEPAVTEKTTVKILGNEPNKNLNVISEVDETTNEKTSEPETSQIKSVKTE